MSNTNDAKTDLQVARDVLREIAEDRQAPVSDRIRAAEDLMRTEAGPNWGGTTRRG